MIELNFQPGKTYEFTDINDFRVIWRLKYLETVFNPVSKEIRLHFEKLEAVVDKQRDIYISQNDLDQQVGGINEMREYQVSYEY